MFTLYKFQGTWFLDAKDGETEEQLMINFIKAIENKDSATVKKMLEEHRVDVRRPLGEYEIQNTAIPHNYIYWDKSFLQIAERRGNSEIAQLVQAYDNKLNDANVSNSLRR